MIKKRRIIILAIIVVIAIGASATAAILLSQQQNKSSSNDGSKQGGESSIPAEKPAEKTADSADKSAFEGDVQGGVKQLDEAIKNTSDSEEQYIYYSRKATLLLNHNILPDALEAAKKAYELRNSSDSAALVGQVAQAQGNTALAIEYYKKAIEHLDTSDPFADEDRAYYQGLVTQLGGTL
jgi:tetratricopeptide (TPR) repeat protein